MVPLIMFGFLLAYLIIVIIFAKLAFKWRGGKQRVAIFFLLAVVLIPTWDIPLDRYRFNRLCEQEAGIFVYQKVGLPAEFFYTSGEPIEKIIYREDGGSGLRTVKATGNEINLDKLKERYVIDDSFDNSIADWGKVSRLATTVSDGEEVLGQSVSLYGEFGWFSLKFSLGANGTCPDISPHPGYVSIHEKIINDIFYKWKLKE